MEKKLIKHGNSWAIVLDKSLLKLLNVKTDEPITLSTDGKSIILTPSGAQDLKIDKISDDKEVQKAYETVLRKYDAAFKKLADK